MRDAIKVEGGYEYPSLTDNDFYEREEQPRWCSRCERWDEDCICEPETPVERPEPFSATELRDHIEKLCHGLPVREIGGMKET